MVSIFWSFLFYFWLGLEIVIALAQRDESCQPVFRNLPCIDLLGQVAVDDLIHPHR